MIALLVIDMQNAYFEAPELAAQQEGLVASCNRLLEAFRAGGHKALMVGTASGRFDELVVLLETGKPFKPHRVKPLIAIPTTAGTGSEVTPWATIWDRAAGRKHSLHLPETWPEAAIVDPRTRALAARVAVREAPSLTARSPAERVCRLTLRLRGGEVREREVVGTPGDPGRPLPEEALRGKFRRCTEPAFGPRWGAAWQAARRPDGLADLSALF